MLRFGIAIFLMTISAANADTVRFVTEDFAPFNYQIGDKVSGPGAEIARLICASLKVECTFEILPFRRAIDLIQAGEADVIFSVAQTPERDNYMIFSRPFVQTGYAFFTLTDKGYKLTNLNDLKSFTVAAYGPSGTYSVLEKAKQEKPDLSLVQEVSFEATFRKLIAGRYNEPAAVFANRNVGALWLKNNGLANVALALQYGNIQYRFGFSKQSKVPEFGRKFDDALGMLQKTPAVAKIIEDSGFSANDLPTE